MNKTNQVNQLKLLILLSLINKINQNEIEETNLTSNYKTIDNHKEEKIISNTNQRNLCQFVLISENPCYNNPSIISKYTNGAGVETSFGIDALNRLTSKSFGSLLTQVYTYDKAGNITNIVESKTGVRTFQREFTYDSYNRC